MVLCIIPWNFRLIDEILNELERQRRWGRIDGQTGGRMEWRQYPSAPMAADRKYKDYVYRKMLVQEYLKK